MKRLPLLFFFTWLSSMPNIDAASLESAHFPSLVSSLRIDMPLEFCGEPVPVKSQEIRERLEKELLLSLWDRPQVILWLKRSSRYLPLETQRYIFRILSVKLIFPNPEKYGLTLTDNDYYPPLIFDKIQVDCADE